MNTDFLDAHQRHLEDAKLLHSQNRLANADHLYGMSAECGLKRLMQVFGMRLNASTQLPQNRHDRVHADGIWQRYELYRSGHVLGPRYPLLPSDPFSDWRASQRYANRSDFDQVRVQRHEGGANFVSRLVNRVRMETGLL